MYNWNIDLFAFKNREDFTVWKLNQLINFGPGGEKINLSLVRKYWKRLVLDPNRKKFLSLILWGKTS